MSRSGKTDLIRELAADDGWKEESKSASAIKIDQSELDYAVKKKDLEQKDEEIKGLQQDREQRKQFSQRIFVFMCAYMAVALFVVVCCGFGWMNLNESVLITLLTTTLANVIGVFNFVAKYLFPTKS